MTNLTVISSVEIVNIIVRSTFILIGIIGRRKKVINSNLYDFDLFNSLFQYYADFNFKQVGTLTYLANNNLPKGYKYFGINDGVANLRYFVQYNPFFASALTTVVDPITKAVKGFMVDPYANNTLYAQITDLLNDDVKRVVALFTTDFSTVTFTDVFVGKSTNKKPHTAMDPLTDYDKAYLLLSNILHYAQHIHGSTHVSTVTSYTTYINDVC